MGCRNIRGRLRVAAVWSDRPLEEVGRFDGVRPVWFAIRTENIEEQDGM